MSNGKSTISVLALAVSLVTLILVGYVAFSGNNSNKAVDYTIQKNLAGELIDNNLYQAAIDEYKSILEDPNIDIESRANLNYLIGRVYFEHLHDYENAAAYYVKARNLNPEGNFYDEAGKNLISSLERMGRVLDAKRELDKAVNIDSVYAEHKGETVVAKIGDKPIFLSDVEDNIQSLPPEMQKQFLSKESKLDALNGYIGVELIYRAAVRDGLDKDPEIEKLTENVIKQAVVDKYLKEKVMSDIKIDDNDVRNYFQANKDSKYADKKFDDVKETVYRDYQQEKVHQAFQDYVNKLAAAENVQIFEEKLK